MTQKNLIICDKETAYASAFADYLGKRPELNLQVQVCDDVAYVAKLQDQRKIDCLFISSEYPQEARQQLKAGQIFLLVGDDVVYPLDQEVPVYRYQPAQQLLATFVTHCSAQEAGEVTFAKKMHREQKKIIGVFSPVHRIGKTSYAISLGEKLADSASVLYLNLELYGGYGGHFEAGGQTISDVLYYARQEKANLGMMIPVFAGHKNRLDYIGPAQVSDDVRKVAAEEWIRVIQKIAEESIYEVLILDLDEGLQEVYRILSICTEIHMPVISEAYALSKVEQFMQELELLELTALKEKIVQKEQT